MRWTIAAALVAAGACLADATDDVEAKMMQYFELFNARDVAGITEEIYAVPVHIASEAGHRSLSSDAASRDSLRNLYTQIEAQGWVRSVIDSVDVCLLSDGLAFAETRYARIDADGKPIPPDVRTNVYVLRKLETGWRIVAFYPHDPGRKFDC